MISFKLRWGYLYSEYKPNTYFWEFSKMFVRVGFIVPLSFYHDYTIIKGVLVYLIIILYGELLSCYSPYYDITMNKFDKY